MVAFATALVTNLLFSQKTRATVVIKMELTNHSSKYGAVSDPCYWIREAYAIRKKKNSAYSLRGFARDLGMSHPLLSQILNGHRTLTLKQAHKIAALLQLMPSEQKAFLDCVLHSLPENSKTSQKIKLAREKQNASYLVKNVDVEKFHLISNWYHLSILDLATTHDFRPNASWIAKRLGISKIEVDSALERLLLLGLLEKKNKTLVKKTRHLHWIPEDSKIAIRTYHRQMIEKSVQELEKTDLESFKKRSITSNSIAINESRVEEARKFIYEFEQEFAKRFSTEKVDEVYQLNLQFFPVTKKEN